MTGHSHPPPPPAAVAYLLDCAWCPTEGPACYLGCGACIRIIAGWYLAHVLTHHVDEAQDVLRKIKAALS